MGKKSYFDISKFIKKKSTSNKNSHVNNETSSSKGSVLYNNIFKKWWFWAVIAVVFFGLIFGIGIASERADENEVKLPTSANDYNGQNYEDVVKELEMAGFTNIEVQKIEDLVTGWLTNDGSVEEVSINNVNDYKAGDIFPIDAKIVVSYHTFSESEIDETEKIPDDGSQKIVDEAEGRLAYEVKEELETLGYTVTVTHDNGTDWTESIQFESNPNDKTTYIPWIVTEVSSYDRSGKTVTLHINNKKMLDEAEDKTSVKSTLESKLDVAYAWQAVESHGKSEYTYGFDLDWWTGKLAEEAKNEKTWFLKATCNVKNLSGVWEKGLTCEATVTGTDDNPIVKSFKVY